ncbi:MAG: PAS domain S-box protein [Cytophagaceae bacterium]
MSQQSAYSSQDKDRLKFEILAQNAGVGIWHLNAAGYTEYMNPAMCEILNIGSARDIEGKTFHSFFTEESLQRMKVEHAKRFQKKCSTYEVELIRSKGEKRNILVSGSPVVLPDGSVDGMIATFMDITEKRTSEVELKKSEERFRGMFEKIAMPMGISRNGLQLIVNEAFQELFQYKAEEVIGTSILSVVDASCRDRVMAQIKARAEGRYTLPTYEVVAVKKDGTRFPVRVEASHIELPDGMATVVSIKDITHEKEAEEALRTSEVKFRGIFGSNMIGISYSDRINISDANDRFLRITGYTMQDLEQGKINWTDLTPREYDERDEKAVQEIREKGFITPYEKEFIRKDGTRVPVLIAATMLEGQPGFGTTMVVDISDLKESRDQATKLASELSTFMYMASHDLKGPLASVIGLTNIAKNDIEDPKAAEYLNLIQECTQKLDRSLMNFLRIIRIKDSNLQRVPIDLSMMVEDILFSLKHQVSFANTEFQVCNQIRSEFRSDEDLVRSMIQNLVENSVKYQTRMRRPFVKIGFKEEGENILITVDDNGRGIDAKIMDKIFDIFYRGDISSKGSGLGLYIVKNAVEKLGGKVTAESKKEGGALFTLTIPKNRE